jgi:hypothetical protein
VHFNVRLKYALKKKLKRRKVEKKEIYQNVMKSIAVLYEKGISWLLFFGFANLKKAAKIYD